MKLSQLTFTRFAFCLVVVFYHYAAPTIIKFYPATEPVFYYIHSFISYFFLLSGFILVISSSGKRGQPTDRQFWLNRFARVYPLYLFAFLLSLAAIAAVGDQPSLYIDNSLAKPALASVLLVQAWVPDYAYYSNYPGWSLSVEAFLYFLFPFLFRALRGLSARNLITVAGLGWVLTQALQLYLNGASVSKSFINAFPVFHIATFVMGICLGICFVRHFAYLKQHRKIVGIGSLIGMVLGSYLINTQSSLIHHFEPGLFAPIFALIILYLCTQENWVVRQFSQPTAVYLGEISYGVYILQAPVAVFVRHINKNWLHWNMPLAFLLLIIVLLLVSVLCYEYIEKPGRNWLRHLTNPSTQPAASQLAPKSMGQ